MSDRPSPGHAEVGASPARGGEGQSVHALTEPIDMRALDTANPSVARCYDAMLGGKDNYAVDRAFVTEVLRRVPSMYSATVDNRRWLVRVVRYLAGIVGIDQFLDLGSGLPTAENTHQVAQRSNPDAVVVYVDNDPMVLAHGKALLADNEHTQFAPADLTRPAELLTNPAVARHLDFSRPVGLLQVGTLHHVSDEQDPHAIMARYLDALPSGSYVAVSHFHRPEDGEEGADVLGDLEELLLGGIGSGRFRSRAEIIELFDGTELVRPGVVRLCDWWPDGPQVNPRRPGQNLLLGGLGRVV